MLRQRPIGRSENHVFSVSDSKAQPAEISAMSDDKSNDRKPLRVAVLVPCFNEEAAIGKVVGDFHAALPAATVYVYDNNSADRTIAAGARRRRGGAS